MVNLVGNRLQVCVVFIILLIVFTPIALAQSTAFTYQGRLNDNSQLANGNYDFEFRLFDAVVAGTQHGATVAVTGVAVTGGIFTVGLDFGACASCFNGASRFLEIRVKPSAGATFTTLSPRQQITSTPYAIKSLNAATADGLSLACVNCVTSSQIQSVQGAQISGAIPVSSVPAGSASYVQNTSSLQPLSNFNISGNGTAGGTLSGNIVNSTTQFNINNIRVLSNPGLNNLFAGVNAGNANTTGSHNTFFGRDAGAANMEGSTNSFFGREAGAVNLTGSGNSFFGQRAGGENTAGGANSFFGRDAGNRNTTGSNNTIIGNNADVGPNNLTNASALGYRAYVESSNSIVLGSIDGKNGGTADTKVGIGTTMPGTPLEIESSTGTTTFRMTNWGSLVSILGRTSRGSRSSPTPVIEGQSLLLIGAEGYTGSGFGGTKASIFLSAAEDWSTTANGTSISFWTTPNGSSSGDLPRVKIEQDGKVGIGLGLTGTAVQKLDVSGDIRIGLTGTTLGCVEDRNGTVIAGVCSSDLRFKRDITAFGNILNRFVRLRPVNFFWRADEFADKHFGNKPSFGLIAQEVEPLFPDLVATDEAGFKTVNYSKLPLLTIQAVKELKSENDVLKSQLGELQRQFRQQQQAITDLRKRFRQRHGRAVRSGLIGKG
jgi:hypothetical protein